MARYVWSRLVLAWLGRWGMTGCGRVRQGTASQGWAGKAGLGWRARVCSGRSRQAGQGKTSWVMLGQAKAGRAMFGKSWPGLAGAITDRPRWRGSALRGKQGGTNAGLPVSANGAVCGYMPNPVEYSTAQYTLCVQTRKVPRA